MMQRAWAFPRPTLTRYPNSPTFSPSTQVNIICAFEEGYMVTENHAVKLYRAP